jgi:hypothetical protein
MTLRRHENAAQLGNCDAAQRPPVALQQRRRQWLADPVDGSTKGRP